jgi:hypothetical protein
MDTYFLVIPRRYSIYPLWAKNTASAKKANPSPMCIQCGIHLLPGTIAQWCECDARPQNRAFRAKNRTNNIYPESILSPEVPETIVSIVQWEY